MQTLKIGNIRLTRLVGTAIVLVLLVLGLSRAASLGVWPWLARNASTAAQRSDDLADIPEVPEFSRPDDAARAAPVSSEHGLLINEPTAFPGYTLLAPMNSTNTYLIDMQGRVVRQWTSEWSPGANACLLKNGHLLRAGMVPNVPFFEGGAGGRVQEFTWDGKLVWEFIYRTNRELPHHEVRPLPSGNVLLIVWQKKSEDEAIAAGRRPETLLSSGLLSCSIIEVKPTGPTSGKVVWAWHAWDHLVQDFDATRANHGDVGAHPERIDLNFGDHVLAAMIARPTELAKLQAIGYVGGPSRRPRNPQQDWLHINAVDYNADLDQLMLTVYEFSEVWIIDHGTSTSEAAGHTGGRYGKGGDLLYRWGNPRAYRASSIRDQQLFSPHNAHWIPHGLPGQGHALIFNNGSHRRGGSCSSIDEIVLPVDVGGHYASAPGKPFAPEQPVWTYVAPKRFEFFSTLLSGAQRLPNGNTLICSGMDGAVFEVTPAGRTVWKYVNPDKKEGLPFGGAPPGSPFSAPPGTLLPPFVQASMHLAPEQMHELRAAETDMTDKLARILTQEQKKQLRDRPLNFRDFPTPGQLLSAVTVERLKLTVQQKKQLARLQAEGESRLNAILDQEQQRHLQQIKAMVTQLVAAPIGAIPPSAPGGGPPGPAGFKPPGGVPPGLFRAPRYSRDYPGLAGKDLTAGKTIEDLQTNDAP